MHACDRKCLCGVLETLRLTAMCHEQQSESSMDNVLKQGLVEVI